MTEVYMYRALLWKLWRTARRSVISVTFSIMIPIVVCLILVYFKTKESSKSAMMPETRPAPHPYQGLFTDYVSPNKFEILYTPINPDTDRLMGEFKKILPASLIKTLRGINDTKSMEDWFFEHYADKHKAFSESKLGYGVIFDTLTKTKLSFTLRNTISDIWNTDKKFPAFLFPGPQEISAVYFYQGFIQVQTGINLAYMNYLEKPINDWFLEEFPYPSYYKESSFKLVLQVLTPLLFIFSFIYMLQTVATNVIEEKKSGAREMMRLNGLKLHMIYGYWFLRYFIISAISVTVIIILLKTDFGTKPILQYSSPIILWLFFMIYCSMSILLIFAISSLFTNSKFALIVVLFVSIITYSLFNNIKSISGYIMVLFPVGAILKGFETIVTLESARVGVQFSNLLYKTPNTSEIPLIFIVLEMLFASLIYMLFCLYFDAIKPGDYGRAQPWHFIFPNSLKKMCKVLPSEKQLIEEAPVKGVTEKTNLPVGIQVQNVYKMFGNFAAVNGLTMDIYKNQITALLGHNGAGKTTLISILTGIISPTSGEVYVDGKDIFFNLNEFRKNLGFCPQHDMLLPDLTVYEHMIFFGLIKGMERSDLETKTKNLLEKFQLDHRSHSLVSKLSGGMKRKLCLAIALINDPKVLFLDEPTSGLDPQSRRNIWDILLLLRGNRTVLITTHFMEEADVLGDHIAIMAHGEMRCYGSSLFLKKHYGSGYHITLRYENNKCINQIQNIIHSIPNIKIVNQEQQNQLVFQVPKEQEHNLQKLFTELENAMKSLKILSIGVNCSSMEDVFLSVQKSEGISTSFDETDTPMQTSGKFHKSGGLVLRQMYALFIKRFLWLKRNIILFLFMLVVLPGLVTWSTVSNSVSIWRNIDKKPLLLDLSQYGETKVVIGGLVHNSQVKLFADKVEAEQSFHLISTVPTQEQLLQEAVEDESFYRTSMIVAAEFVKTPIIFYSSLAFHSPAIGVNLLFYSLLNDDNASNEKISITTYNYPYLFNSDSCNRYSVEVISIKVAWAAFCVSSFAAFLYFCLFPIYERTTQVKHLQYMTGLRSFTYWCSILLVDCLFLLMTLAVISLVIFLVDDVHMFTNSLVFSTLMLILFLFGVSVILLTYVLSFIFNTYAKASSVTLIIGALVGIFANFIMPLISSNKVLQYIWYILPWSPFVYAIVTSFTDVAAMTVQSNICKDETLIPNFNNASGLDKFNINTELIFLAVDALIFAILTIILDFGYIQSFFWHFINKYYGEIDYNSDIIDADVAKEKDDVDLVQSDSSSEDKPVLMVDGLGRKFKRSITSVHDVSFNVKQGECFGLLGVNGAGKTTTFSMLAARIRPSKGDAIINSSNKSYALSTSKHKFLQCIGYCPQENVLLAELSGQQMLNLFSRLRGAPEEEVHILTQKWINLLDLHLYSEKPCGTYSGGNKRKLCAALAFIGNPPVILLDEPTTGVDPVTRRKVWKVLQQTQLNYQTVVITSHSMDECEAVCNRLTIMVKGYMQCIGPIQYLKQKFAQGFTLLIKLKFDGSTHQLELIKSEVEDRFGPYCNLKDEHQGLLHYHIQNTNFMWSHLFGEMNRIKLKYEMIDDFMLSDTSLEQVFLAFAKDEK